MTLNVQLLEAVRDFPKTLTTNFLDRLEELICQMYFPRSSLIKNIEEARWFEYRKQTKGTKRSEKKKEIKMGMLAPT